MKKTLLFATMVFALAANAQLRLVKDINTGYTSSNPISFYAYNGRIYFSAVRSPALNDRAIFATDGTAAGTVNIRFDDPNTGLVALNPFSNVLFYEYNSNLYFDAKDNSASNTQIMKLTGVSNAATSVYDLMGQTLSNLSRFVGAVGVNDKIVFSPLVSVGEVEPLVIDLTTPANSGILYEVNPGTNTSSLPLEFTTLGTNCFFAAANPTSGRELWSTNGTNFGTSLYLDMFAGTGNGNPAELNVLGSQLTFVATHASLGRELFRTNGTGSLTLLKDINTSGDSNPNNATAIGGLLYFSASNGTIGQELWTSAGTTLSTQLISDINPGAADGNPNSFTQVGTTVFFVATNTFYGTELWKTDGTDTGTVLVKDINPSTISSNPTSLTAYNGKLYFLADNGTNGIELWMSDGTAAGTTMVVDMVPGSGSSSIANLTVLGDELYFGGTENLSVGVGFGRELYAYKDPSLAVGGSDFSENKISLYPNPAKNYFELAGNVTIEKVEIYSILGQLVKTFGNQQQYSVADLNKGSYIVKITTQEGISSKTFLIE